MMKMFMERQAAMMQMMTHQNPGPSSDGSEHKSYVHLIGSQLVQPDVKSTRRVPFARIRYANRVNTALVERVVGMYEDLEPDD